MSTVSPATSFSVSQILLILLRSFRAISSWFNTSPMSKKESQPDLPEPNVRNLNRGSKIDASNTNADTYSRGRVSVPAWKPPGLSLVRMSTVRSSCIAGGQSQQRKPTQLSKEHAVSIKGEIQKTVGNGDPPAVPIRRRVIEKTAVPNDPAVPTQSRVVQETAIPNDHAVPIQRRMTQKAAIPKDDPLSTQRRGISESSGPKYPAVPIQRTVAPKAPPVPIASSEIKKTLVPKTHAPSITRSESTKTSAPQEVSHKKTKKIKKIKKTQLTDPVHHITWDGWNEEREPLGNSCVLCDKDLSCGPQDTLHSNEDRFENYDAPVPRMLPAVDILLCGHAFHSKCLEFVITEEQSSDPPCILCLSLT